MKYSTGEPELSNLSVKAKNSSLIAFLRRIALAVGAAPLGGYLLGRLIERLWPEYFSWALTLSLLSLVMGVIYLGLWMKRDIWGDPGDRGRQSAP